MNAVSDTRDWLRSPAGRIYSIVHGGDGPAYDKLESEAIELGTAVISLNLDRMSRGLPALDADRARVAVAPRPVTEISGTVPDLVSVLSRDPAWRWSWAPEPLSPPGPGVIWQGPA